MAGEQRRPLRVLAWTEKRGRAEPAWGTAGGYPSQEEGGSPEHRTHGVLEENGQAQKTHPKASPKNSVGG